MEKLCNVFKTGINYMNYGKANYTLEILKYGPVRKELGDMLTEHPDLVKKLGISLQEDGRQGFYKRMRAEVSEDIDVLEKIFDMLIGDKLKGKKGDKKREQLIKEFGEDGFEMEMEQVERNRERIEYDIILPLLYYLTMMETSRDFLWEKYKNEKEELIRLCRNSVYYGMYFWSLIPGIYLEQAFCILGLILKSREQDEKEINENIIMAIKRNNRKISNYLKKIYRFHGQVAREVANMNIELYKDNSLLQTSAMLAGLVVAESFGKKIEVDYDMNKMLFVIRHYWARFEKNKQEKDEDEEIRGKSQEIIQNNNRFLNEFKQEFVSNNCIGSIFWGLKHNDVINLASRIYGSYHINTKKFQLTKLPEKEVKDLVNLSDDWSKEKYCWAIQIAVLCKYINELEDFIKEKICHNASIGIEDLKKQEAYLMQESIKMQALRKEWEKEKECLEKRNQELVNELTRQQKVGEEKEKQSIKDKEELISLRNYVYQLTEEENDLENDNTKYKEEQRDKVQKFWSKQAVVVIGGHINWQQKIENVFPKWSYVSANQRAFVADMINDKAYIICNTEILSHSVYYKVVANKRAAQKLIYTKGCNIEKFLVELEEQNECLRPIMQEG